MLEPEQIANRLPDVQPFDYLIEILTRLGVASNSGGSVTGLSWAEIDAFARSTGTKFELFELDMIRAMSGAYAASVKEYDGRNAAAPYFSEDAKRNVAQSVKNALRMIKPGKQNDRHSKYKNQR